MTERRFDIIRMAGARWLLTDSGTVGEQFSSHETALERALELASAAAGRTMVYLWEGDEPEKIYDAMIGSSSRKG